MLFGSVLVNGMPTVSPSNRVMTLQYKESKVLPSEAVPYGTAGSSTPV